MALYFNNKINGKQVWKRRVTEHNWQGYFRPFSCGIMGLKIQRPTKEETRDAQTLRLASHADVLRAWDVSFQSLSFVFLSCETAACPHNTYNDGSTIYCQPCPANSGHSLTGSRSVSDCKCFKGYQGRPEVGNPCTGEKDPFFASSTRYFSDVFENGSFLPVSISLCPYVNGVFRHQKRWFSYTIPREEIFENAGFSVFLSSFGRTKTVIHHIGTAEIRFWRRETVFCWSASSSFKIQNTGNFELVFNASPVGDKKLQNLERKLKT